MSGKITSNNNSRSGGIVKAIASNTTPSITDNGNANAITIDSSENVEFTETIKVDDILESTSAHGIEIDGITIKDASVMVPSGGSIQFHPHGSSPSNSLDDYEEGTWTPGVSLHASGSAAGVYVKIGAFVWLGGNFYYPDGAASSLNSLPFTVGSGAKRGGGAIVYQDNDSTARSILPTNGGTNSVIYDFGQSATNYPGSDKTFNFFITYFTDS